MELTKLLAGIPFTGQVTDFSARGIPTQDSRQINKNSVFFCIVGEKVDGHKYAEQALADGALAIVVQQDLGLKNQLLVADTHMAYSLACSNYFDNPAKKLKLIAVTGTNGKTTITYIVQHILKHMGAKVGVIGSVQNVIHDMIIPAKYTTPNGFELHALFARMVQAGCEYVVMEASSHGLDQKRVEGLQFEAGGFTNLTQDHLDYHGTMERYFVAKKKLFEVSRVSVINSDDAYGQRIIEEYSNSITFSVIDEKATLFASDISYNQRGSEFILHYKNQSLPVQYPQPGLFSVSNALTATGLCLVLGLTLEQITDGLNTFEGVAGRFEIIPTTTNFTVVRDFAHSADGLEKLLSTVKKIAPNKIITVFGCAGQRDRTKRPAMAEAVAKYSDYIAITSDNPRQEPEQQIIDDALSGFDKYPTVNYVQFTDRLEAIRWAIKQCQKDDMLILAGKGHEDYQVLHDGTVYFNEREIMLELTK